MQERNRIHLAAARQRFLGSNDFIRRPIAAFNQNIRLHQLNQFGGRIFVEPCYQIHTFQRGGNGGTVFQRIDRAVVSFAQPAHGSIGI